MRRREFITVIAGVAVAWPMASRAQQAERMRRIGVLMAFAENDPEAQSWVAGFREELGKLGWTEGHNIQIDTRWATADVESLQRFAKELVALQSDFGRAAHPPLRRCSDRQAPSHYFRDGRRSCRQRLRRKPVAAGWQPDRFHTYRELLGWQVG